MPEELIEHIRTVPICSCFFLRGSYLYYCGQWWCGLEKGRRRLCLEKEPCFFNPWQPKKKKSHLSPPFIAALCCSIKKTSTKQLQIYSDNGEKEWGRNPIYQKRRLSERGQNDLRDGSNFYTGVTHCRGSPVDPLRIPPGVRAYRAILRGSTGNPL